MPRYSLVYVVRGSAATSSLSPERFVDRDDVGSPSKQGRRRDPRPGAAFEHPLPRERFERVETASGYCGRPAEYSAATASNDVIRLADDNDAPRLSEDRRRSSSSPIAGPATCQRRLERSRPARSVGVIASTPGVPSDIRGRRLTHSSFGRVEPHGHLHGDGPWAREEGARGPRDLDLAVSISSEARRSSRSSSTGPR